MLESQFQSKLIKKLEYMFDGCIILKNDAANRQGVPDLIILHGDRWAALEVKKSINASHRPNQDWYVRNMDAMSFASFISPETEEEVLHALQRSFRSRRKARIS